MSRNSFVAVLGVALASAWAVGCGSAHDALPTLGSTGGAAIQGTVESDGVSSSADVSALSAPSGGLKVSVQGTSLSTTTDKEGRFTLTGIPAGEATLRFQGSGVDARLTIGGLVEGQTLTISVSVSGSTARLLSARGVLPEIELIGKVESVTPPSLVVQRLTVMTDAQTVIKQGRSTITLADIAAGDNVKVKGRRRPDSIIQAIEIEVLQEGTSPGAAMDLNSGS